MTNSINPVRKIFNLLKLEKNEISAIYFYAIMNGLIQLSLPVGVQSIISYVLGASMRASLIVLISLVVAGVLIVGILQINQMKIIEKIQQKLFVRYSFAFAQHIPAMDLKKNDAVYMPELVNRFFDVPLLQKSLSKILLDVPTALIQIIFGLLLLTFYHPAFILFGVILILILFLILKYTGGKGIATSLEKSKYKYKVAGWLEEMARIIKSTKLAKSNQLHIEKTDEQVSNYLVARNNHFQVLVFQFNVLVVFKTIITAAMLIVGTLLMINQQLTVGQFIAAEIVILLVLNSVEKLIINLGSVYDTITAVEKASEITDKPVEKNGNIDLNDINEGVKLQLNDVSFSYNDERYILNNISFNIKPNEKVCISGKDSAGKSTLLKLMAGAYLDFKGSVLIDDIPIGNYNLDSLRAKTGVFLNEQDIFQGTVLENINLGNEKITANSIREYAEKTGLNDFIGQLKDGYDTLLDPTGKRLPRNVVHRILLVRALVNKPRLLLLEEPWMTFSNGQKQKILELINEIKHTTIVIVSNDTEFAKQCDQVIEIDNNGSLK